MNKKQKTQRGRRLIDLTQDLSFKHYFKGSDTLLISLLNQFLPLDQKIKSVEVLDPHLSSNKKKKSPALDLRVRLDNNTSVNVEMQTISKKNFKERILFYLSKLYTWRLQSGEDYKKVYPAYSLVFTSFRVFEEFEDYYSLFEWRSKSHPHVVFSKYMGIVLVELSKFKKEDIESFDLKDVWCYFIKNAGLMTRGQLERISKRGREMKEAAVRIVKLSKEESALMIEEAQEKARRDRVAEIEYAKEEGEKIGEIRGIEKGKIAGMELVALNMLKNKMDMNLIIKMTGLPQSKILKLKNQKK